MGADVAKFGGDDVQAVRVGASQKVIERAIIHFRSSYKSESRAAR